MGHVVPGYRLVCDVLEFITSLGFSSTNDSILYIHVDSLVYTF